MVGPAGVFAASLFDLYRMSAVPSFFVGPAAAPGAAAVLGDAVFAGFAVVAVAVEAGLATSVDFVAAVVASFLAGFVFSAVFVCAIPEAALNSKMAAANKILFIM